jgi:hypothetical protein
MAGFSLAPDHQMAPGPRLDRLVGYLDTLMTINDTSLTTKIEPFAPILEDFTQNPTFTHPGAL